MRRTLVGLLVVMCLVTSARAEEVASAPASRPAGTSELPDALARVYPAVVDQIARIRGLAWQGEVDASVQERDALRERLLEIVDKEIPAKTFADRELVLRRLGLYEEDGSLRDFVVDMYTAQIAGFYDSEKDALHLLDDIAMFSIDILAHELMHALQDQHWDLDSLPTSDQSNSDQGLALMALIEGDATLTGVVFMQRRLGQGTPGSFRALTDMVDRQMDLTFKVMDVPGWFKEEMVFPYKEGGRFVAELLDSGGFARVDEAFDSPPLSTEQILHPEKYLATERDHPQAIEIPDLGDALGGGWERIFNDCVGELGVRILLRKFTPALAERAAAGWDGDRLVAYRRGDDGPVVIAMVSEWDSDADAREFQLAMLDSQLQRDEALVRAPEQPASGAILLEGRGDTAFLERRGGRLIFIQGAPSERLDAVREKLWQSRAREVTELTRVKKDEE